VNTTWLAVVFGIDLIKSLYQTISYIVSFFFLLPYKRWLQTEAKQKGGLLSTQQFQVDPKLLEAH
jgi:hypothetical protein